MKRTLPKGARIKKKAEIDRVYKKGRRARGRLLKAHILKNDLGSARLAVSVPKRLGSAVKRNRWKRLIRESFRLHRLDMPAVDLLVIPNRPPGDLKRQDVEEALLALLRRPKGKKK
ncbi:MAG: ribonuclease P protein component [Planctomycetota bacterium]